MDRPDTVSEVTTLTSLDHPILQALIGKLCAIIRGRSPVCCVRSLADRDPAHDSVRRSVVDFGGTVAAWISRNDDGSGNESGAII